jgi:hypothetical protein
VENIPKRHRTIRRFTIGRLHGYGGLGRGIIRRHPEGVKATPEPPVRSLS